MDGTDTGDDQVQRRLAAVGLAPDPRPVRPVAPFDSVDSLRPSFRGALIGTAVGDALGRPAEGQPASVLRESYGRLTNFRPWSGWRDGPKGTITDDTQMTICVAECLVANDGRIDPADLAERFVAWLPVGRGKGRTCVKAVSALTAGVPWYEAGVASAGNGAAIRAAPIGLALIANLDALRRDAALSAVVTHRDPMAVVSAVAHAWLVARLVAMAAGTLDVEVLVAELCEAISDLHDPGAPERDWEHRPGKTAQPIRLCDRLAEIPEQLSESPESASDWSYCGAFVLESLPIALWHFLHASEDPEQAVVNAVMGGHDADTVASMTGAYAGAYLGEEAFPARWTGDDLESAGQLRNLADELVGLAALEAARVDA